MSCLVLKTIPCLLYHYSFRVPEVNFNAGMSRLRYYFASISQKKRYFCRQIVSRIMIKSDKKKILRFVVMQVAFCVVFLFSFVHFSFLRPLTHTFVEVSIAVILATAMLINVWFVYPKFHEKIPKYSLFAVFSIEALLLAALEFALTFQTNRAILSGLEGFDHNSMAVYLPLFVGILLRDCAWILLSVFVADYMDLKIWVINTEELLRRGQNQMIVSDSSKDVFLDIDQIYLCTQFKNSTYIYTVDGQEFHKRSTLREMEDFLREFQFVRISKNSLLRLSAIRDCLGHCVRLKACFPSDNQILQIGASYEPVVMPVIQRYLQTHSDEPIAPDFQDAEMKDVDESDDINLAAADIATGTKTKVLQIKEYISTHPGTKSYQICENLDIPQSTVSRYLGVLQNHGLVVRKGSKKTGGYWVADTIIP